MKKKIFWDKKYCNVLTCIILIHGKSSFWNEYWKKKWCDFAILRIYSESISEEKKKLWKSRFPKCFLIYGNLFAFEAIQMIILYIVHIIHIIYDDNVLFFNVNYTNKIQKIEINRYPSIILQVCWIIERS